MSERGGRDVLLLLGGALCPQAMAAAYADLFRSDADTVMQRASGSGGGVGRMHEICGVVLGMAMPVVLKAGNRTPGDRAAKKAANPRLRQITGEFRRQFVAIVSRHLPGREKPDTELPPDYKKQPYAEDVKSGGLIVERCLLDGNG